MALVHTTSTWSKLDDSISRAQLAALADVDERNVAHAMKRLEAGGHVVYMRSRIKGIASIVRLNGVATVTTRNDEMGWRDEANGVANYPEWGGDSDHPPEDPDPEDLYPSVVSRSDCTNCDSGWTFDHNGNAEALCATCKGYGFVLAESSR